ncbi:MAG: hypothetical protein V3581_02885 [Candidatus Cardinium sp.]
MSYPKQQYTFPNQSDNTHHTNLDPDPSTNDVPRLYPQLPQ